MVDRPRPGAKLSDEGASWVEHNPPIDRSCGSGARVPPVTSLQACKVDLTYRQCQASFPFVQNEVRKARADKGLRQEDLASAMKVSRQTINAIETGRYLPSLPLAIALARFFGKQVEELFHEDDDGR